ncbi:MAG TPA: carboxypeptidase-like regulatory domain-containing protein, partial [Kofleriaceae bacterium]
NGYARATTDENGIAIAGALRPIMYWASLFAAGYADEHRVSISVTDEPGAVIERHIRLRPGAQVSGTVRYPNGDPAVDARVYAWASPSSRSRAPSNGGLDGETRTDESGRWHFTLAAGTYRISTSLERWGARLPLVCDGRTPRPDLDMELSSGLIYRAVRGLIRAGQFIAARGVQRRIAGTVVDTHGQPVARARVNLLMTNLKSSEMTMILAQDQTDANGRFDIEDLEWLTYDMRVDPPGSQLGDAKSALQRVTTGDLNVTFVLATSGAITGRVLLDGVPLTSCTLQLTNHVTSMIKTIDGRFAWPRLAPGTYRLVLLGDGMRRVVLEALVIASGATLDLGDIAMTRGQPIAGIVRDASGVPVRGARVVVGRMHRTLASTAFDGRYEATTDEAGAYAFAGVDPHAMYKSHIWAIHATVGASLVHELSSADSVLDFTLLPTGTIRGKVVGARGGTPSVHAIRADEAERARFTLTEDGVFELFDLPIGDYVVNVVLGSGPPAASMNVTVEANRTHELAFSVVSTAVSLTVRVPHQPDRRLQFEPVTKGAGIDGGGRGVWRHGDEDQWSFSFVRPGSYRASLDGKRWTTVTVAASPAKQTIDLRKRL